MKTESTPSFALQLIALFTFFSLAYILQGRLYIDAVSSAHENFGHLMLDRGQVFIPEYWNHLIPRYILPVSLIMLLGAAFSEVLWTKKSYVFMLFVNFISWPKVEMNSPELSFTILFFSVLLVMSVLMPSLVKMAVTKYKEKTKPALETASLNQVESVS